MYLQLINVNVEIGLSTHKTKLWVWRSTSFHGIVFFVDLSRYRATLILNILLDVSYCGVYWGRDIFWFLSRAESMTEKSFRIGLDSKKKEEEKKEGRSVALGGGIFKLERE